ncbi:MAG: Rrf2 family transcriptional regulator [Coriobacteriaceae bacterium]|nr:Rrf2 family transcriptional regulator [Coriobacteriaceae bacterium]
MKVTRRTDYAVHLLVELAKKADQPQGLRSLAEKHNVTYAFARTVQCGLLAAGIIKTTRGINGGITLARPLKDVTLLEVFEAAQGSLEDTFSSGEASWCNCHKEACPTDESWEGVRALLHSHLSGITIQSIFDNHA